jgi:hypothetical protein
MAALLSFRQEIPPSVRRTSLMLYDAVIRLFGRGSSPRRKVIRPVHHRVALEGLEDRTLLSHGHGHGLALGPLHAPGQLNHAGLVAGSHSHSHAHVKTHGHAAHQHCTLSLSQTVTANFTGSTTFRLTDFAVQNGQLVAVGTVAGQAATANVSFTAATGSTPPTITLTFPSQTFTAGGQTVTLNSITLPLTGPGAPTTDLGTAINNIASTLNGLSNPSDIAAALNPLVTSANSVLSGIAASGTVSGALTLSNFTINSSGQIQANASVAGQSLGTVTLSITGTRHNLAFSIGSLPVSLTDLTGTTGPVPLTASGKQGRHLQQRLHTLEVLMSNPSAMQAKMNALDRVLEALGATCTM